MLPQLLKIREDTVAKSSRDGLLFLTTQRMRRRPTLMIEEFFLSCVTDTCVQKYTKLIALATLQHVLSRAQFLDLGVRFLEKTPGKCPFCGR